MGANRRIRPPAPRAAARSPIGSAPIIVLPCDEFYALQGIRAGGTRSGSAFRLIGTSAAAPQLARWVADAAAAAANQCSVSK